MVKTCLSRRLTSPYRVNNKKEKLEDFKTAISSTVKSISNSEKIEVSFGNQTPKSEKNSIKLPELSQINNKLNFDQIRAIADSKSLNFRFSDDKTFKEYEPVGNISKRLYKISEKIRCEKIGTSYFKGIKNNIEKFYQERISGLDLKNAPALVGGNDASPVPNSTYFKPAN